MKTDISLPLGAFIAGYLIDLDPIITCGFSILTIAILWTFTGFNYLKNRNIDTTLVDKLFEPHKIEEKSQNVEDITVEAVIETF